ncbi:two-component system sensor histidine kinase DesK [Nakamurella sp. UYEF19]|uniref:sensor histidine kinase n=1 Tax=Nakamurella sp. UYEF19 TaxID=1756392 RepID=UPI003395DEC6
MGELSGSSVAAVRLARVLLVSVLVAVTAVQLINVFELPNLTLAETWRAIGFVTVTVLIQAVNSLPSARLRPRWRTAALLAVQAVVTFVPPFEFGYEWGGMVGLLLASILLLLPSPVSWILSVVGLGLVLVVALRAPVPLPFGLIAYLLIANILTTLTVYSVTQLAALVGQLYEARQDIADLAVEQERTRFSRDLHDLLGYSLSAITLKGELAYRLMRVDPDAAQANLEAILGVSRQALSDVRSVARSYRDLSLAAQTTTASAMLESAGISVELTVQDARLPRDIDTVLATVVREGVTNLLRHSKAEHCWITFTRTSTEAMLVIANDGLSEEFAASPPDDMHGDGIGGVGNLRARLQSVGGRLDVTVDEQSRFRLTATVPVEPSPTISRGLFGERSTAAQERATVVPVAPAVFGQKPEVEKRGSGTVR